ncbi:hypothetical protein L596_006472 [Steinernema carpocapsae]|uniref:Uncharacterized protein n=1 Tax=Steinernema carpocapsae TaxID=34508 RepID=A0A4U8V258_STECR|nr:hypothetical protein L596_006472 [Steinernema carpocapsae]
MYSNGASATFAPAADFLPPISTAPKRGKTAPRLQHYHSNLESYLRKLSYQLEALINEQLATVKTQKASLASNRQKKAKYEAEQERIRIQVEEQDQDNVKLREKLRELDRSSKEVSKENVGCDTEHREQQRAEKQARYHLDDTSAKVTATLGIHDVPKQERGDVKVLQSFVDRTAAQIYRLQEEKRKQGNIHDLKFFKNSATENLRQRIRLLESGKYKGEDTWKRMVDNLEEASYALPGEIHDADNKEDRQLQASITAKKNLLAKQQDYLLLLEDWVNTTQHDINESEALTIIAKDDQEVVFFPRLNPDEEVDESAKASEERMEEIEREVCRVKLEGEAKRAAVSRYRSLLETLQSNKRALQRSHSADFPKLERWKPVEKKKEQLVVLYRKEAAILGRQERLRNTLEDLKLKLENANALSHTAGLELKRINEVKEASLQNLHNGHLDHDPNDDELVRLEKEVTHLKAQIAERMSENARYYTGIEEARQKAKQWKTTAQNFSQLQAKINAKHKLWSEIRSLRQNYAQLEKQLRTAQKDLELSVLRRECIVDKAQAAVLAKNSMVRSQQVEQTDKLQKSIAAIRKDLKLAKDLRRLQPT